MDGLKAARGMQLSRVPAARRVWVGRLSLSLSPEGGAPLPMLTTLPLRGLLAPGGPSRPVLGLRKIVTWLILPVVICLSQRLSHACLSISNLYCETANGSLNQLSFI
ncbi:hypothetical protein IWX91DRAFT_208770 [Phyllosticta citricarpa]